MKVIRHAVNGLFFHRSFTNVRFSVNVFAVLANNSAVSDKKGARRLGRASYIVSGTGILVTAIIIGVTVGVIVGGTSAAVSSTVNTVNYSTCNYYIDGACYLYRSYYYSYCSGYAGYDGYCYYN
jgi:hypothetical protein